MHRPTFPSRRRLRLAGALLLLLSLLAPATSARAQEAAAAGLSWAFSFQKGQVDRFRTYIRITGRQADDSGDIKILIKSASRHEVKEVTPDGVATWDQIDEKAEAVINGMPVPSNPERKPVAITFGRNGWLTKRVNPNVPPSERSERAVPLLQSFPTPDRPVKAGESWKVEMPNPLMRGKTVTVTSTLMGVEKVLGIDALKVLVKMDFPTTYGAQENDIAHVEETYYLDAKTFQLLRASYVIKNPLLPFPAAHVEARILVSRIVAGANEKEDPDGEKLLAATPAAAAP